MARIRLKSVGGWLPTHLHKIDQMDQKKKMIFENELISDQLIDLANLLPCCPHSFLS